MNTMRSGMIGIMAAVLSGFFILSILSLGVMEGMITMPPTNTPLPTLAPPNLTPVQLFQASATLLPFTATFPPAPTRCPPPDGWIPYIVQPGDSLAALAEKHGVPLKTLMSKNCLISSQLVFNTLIYLPAVATATPKATLRATATKQGTPACTQPPGWISYTVKPGDTLTRISQLYRVSVAQLREVNCLESDFIRTGQVLWVPNVATSTFTASPSPTLTKVPTNKPPTATFTQTATLTPEPPTAPAPTATSTDTPTATATPTPTETNVPPTATQTVTPTDTPQTLGV